MTRISTFIPAPLLREIKAIAKDHNITTSLAIRKLLDQATNAIACGGKL